ncbi:type II toxin-antitoxin system RelE/ParE family toxin [Streptomyces ochraceiscleroticus]|uniref:Type II toxin-antitoxin system RelE/ParE family toxin n=1 Tax=Streptomyces ochraceiscleroticus TaxID=47761 RepID=A0ABW1MDT9_9ACTN|nr:type II toxin-antitoxin system RelE/ParE family toxin [Streptomyces ochraceiscleroticus]
MWDIVLLEQVEDWFLQLCRHDPDSADRVTDALDQLAAEGPTLGRPMADRIHGSVLHDLKELRPATQWRIGYGQYVDSLKQEGDG